MPDAPTAVNFRLREGTFGALSGWQLQAGGTPVGSIELPWFSQARNARLRLLPDGSARGDVALTLRGRPFRIRHEYTRRGWTNDVRYTLEDDGRVLAQLDETLDPEGRDAVATYRRELVVPVAAELRRRRGWLRIGFDLVAPGGTRLGVLAEPHWFTLRRELDVEIRGLPEPVCAFVAYVAFSAVARAS